MHQNSIKVGVQKNTLNNNNRQTKKLPLLERAAQDIIRICALILVSTMIEIASTMQFEWGESTIKFLLLFVSSVIESCHLHEYWWSFGNWTAFDRIKKVEDHLSYHCGFGLTLTMIQFWIPKKIGIILCGKFFNCLKKK